MTFTESELQIMRDDICYWNGHRYMPGMNSGGRQVYNKCHRVEPVPAPAPKRNIMAEWKAQGAC